ncbi:histidine phosphatase superfamily [Irpex lacteus]|nr:histidine phosphatase superfamily [Irpex lacteus]
MHPIVKVYLVRHGQTHHNHSHIRQGHLDTELNALNAAGIQQSQLVANALGNAQITAAYSSDLSRAARTAEIILERHPGVQLQRQEALRERALGELEGTDFTKVERSPSSNAETDEALSDRAQDWWKKTILPYTYHNTPAVSKTTDGEKHETGILVVSHAGFINHLIRHLYESGKAEFLDSQLEGEKRYNIPNASISVIELPVRSNVDGEGDGERTGKVVVIGDTRHLQSE